MPDSTELTGVDATRCTTLSNRVTSEIRDPRGPSSSRPAMGPGVPSSEVSALGAGSRRATTHRLQDEAQAHAHAEARQHANQVVGANEIDAAAQQVCDTRLRDPQELRGVRLRQSSCGDGLLELNQQVRANQQALSFFDGEPQIAEDTATGGRDLKTASSSHVSSSQADYSRNSINRSPSSNRFRVSGQSGSSHASNARFEQLPFRIQINATGVWSSSQRSTKSSSLLTIIASCCRACSQMSGSFALTNAVSNTCVAWWPRAEIHRANAGGSCASTRKFKTAAGRRDRTVARRTPKRP